MFAIADQPIFITPSDSLPLPPHRRTGSTPASDLWPSKWSSWRIRLQSLRTGFEWSHWNVFITSDFRYDNVCKPNNVRGVCVCGGWVAMATAWRACRHRQQQIMLMEVREHATILAFSYTWTDIVLYSFSWPSTDFKKKIEREIIGVLLAKTKHQMQNTDSLASCTMSTYSLQHFSANLFRSASLFPLVHARVCVWERENQFWT